MFLKRSIWEGSKRSETRAAVLRSPAFAAVAALLALFAVACENGGSGDETEALCEDICELMIDCDGGDDDTFDSCKDGCLDLAELGDDISNSCEEAVVDAVECARDGVEDLLDEDTCEYGGELRDFLEEELEEAEDFLEVLDEFCDDEDVDDEIEESCDEGPGEPV